VEFSGSLVELRVDHPHGINIKLGNFLVKKQAESIVQCPSGSQALQGFDISVKEIAVPSFDSFHFDRRVQHCHDDHDGQREEGNEHLGPNFEVR
jgi:hypothetical protein